VQDSVSCCAAGGKPRACLLQDLWNAQQPPGRLACPSADCPVLAVQPAQHFASQAVCKQPRSGLQAERGKRQHNGSRSCHGTVLGAHVEVMERKCSTVLQTTSKAATERTHACIHAPRTSYALQFQHTCRTHASDPDTTVSSESKTNVSSLSSPSNCHVLHSSCCRRIKTSKHAHALTIVLTAYTQAVSHAAKPTRHLSARLHAAISHFLPAAAAAAHCSLCATPRHLLQGTKHQQPCIACCTVFALTASMMLTPGSSA
jgi:hypothetical protein